MDDAEIVRRLQGVGDLPGDARRFGERNRSLDDPISEGWTFDELEDERTDPVRLLEPVDDGNVRMIERCQDEGFPLQTGDSWRANAAGSTLTATSRWSRVSRAP